MAENNPQRPVYTTSSPAIAAPPQSWLEVALTGHALTFTMQCGQTGDSSDDTKFEGLSSDHYRGYEAWIGGLWPVPLVCDPTNGSESSAGLSVKHRTSCSEQSAAPESSVLPTTSNRGGGCALDPTIYDICTSGSDAGTSACTTNAPRESSSGHAGHAWGDVRLRELIHVHGPDASSKEWVVLIYVISTGNRTD
ncbi:putative protein isoform X1 [Capsicum galapagoense]